MFKNKNKLESTSDIATYKILSKVSNKKSKRDRKDGRILDWLRVGDTRVRNEKSKTSDDVVIYKDIVMSNVKKSSNKEIAKRLKEKNKSSIVSNYAEKDD